LTQLGTNPQDGIKQSAYITTNCKQTLGAKPVGTVAWITRNLCFGCKRTISIKGIVKVNTTNNESENTDAHSSQADCVTVMKHSSLLPNVKAQKY